jgi:hypothetical protein
MTEDGPDKKKKLSKKSFIKKKKNISSEINAITPEEVRPETKLLKKDILQVEEVIKQAFVRFYDNATIKRHKVKDLEALDTIVSEYLKTFMILGYDLNEEKVIIMHARSPHEKDALVEHLRTTLLGIIGNQS